MAARASSRPLRVLLVAERLDIAGGVERFVCRLGSALAARGMAVALGSVETPRERLAFVVDDAVQVVAARTASPRSSLLPESTEATEPPLAHRSPHAASSETETETGSGSNSGIVKAWRVLRRQWRVGRSLGRLIAAHQPDVTVLNGLVTAVSVLALNRDIGRRAICCDHNHFEARSRPWRRLRARLYPGVAAVVSLTEADAARFRALNEHTVVIGNVSSLQADGVPARPDPCLVLATGRHVAQKGFDLLLRAWRRVAEARPDARLRIVGDGPLRGELQALAGELGVTASVEWVAHSDAMAEQYREAAVFVLASRYEGMPLALLEAQALGVPSVAFDCPTGPAEIVTAETGILVPALDVDALATAIIALLGDPEQRRRMAAAAIARSRACFDPEEHVDRWAALIGRVAARLDSAHV